MKANQISNNRFNTSVRFWSRVRDGLLVFKGYFIFVISFLFVYSGQSLAQPTLLTADMKQSHFLAVVEKSGLLSFLGHDHAVLATKWSANICFDSKNPEKSKVSVRISTKDLRIDLPNARKLGGIEDHGRPSEEDIRDIQKKMQSADVLDVSQYPEIRFDSKTVEVKNENLTMHGLLTMHGTTKEITTEAKIIQENNKVAFSGSFEVDIEDFGIEPSGAALGTVTIDTDVTFQYRLKTVKTNQLCK